MQEHQQDTAHRDARDWMPAQALYTRRMPGGGDVRVELVNCRPGDIPPARLSGRVVMERRATARGPVAEDPVIVEVVEGDDANRIVAELFRIARDNAAIARRLLRRQRRSVSAE